MKVLVADVMGMCFGVRDALDVIDTIPRPEAVTIHGELVHNEAVLSRLDTRCFHTAAENPRHNPGAECRVIDTVCHPPDDHQQPLEALLDQVEATVVVEGRSSNNTRELVARCQERALPG